MSGAPSRQGHDATLWANEIMPGGHRSGATLGASMSESTSLLDGRYTVVTPESVEFDFTLAGPFSRFCAALIDLAVSIAAFSAVAAVLALTSPLLAGVSEAAGFVAWFLVDWFYAVALETLWSGKTVGKSVMGLRAISENGVRMTAMQALLRNLARPVDRLPLFYVVGGVFAGLSEASQRLGDVLAGTIVVRERALKLPAAIRNADDAVVADLPGFQASLRKLSFEDGALLIQAALRREELELSARLSVFEALGTHLESLGFQRPEHWSKEKLVTAVASAHLRAQKAHGQLQK